MIQRRRWQFFVFHLIVAVALLANTASASMTHVAQNVVTDFSRAVTSPHIDGTTFVHPLASVIGNATLEGHIMISPCASVRGDEGQPIFVGDSANIQDGVVLHALETEELAESGEWEFVNGRQFTAEGERVSDGSGYSVYVAERVSLAHQAQIHGPAFVGHDTFIGMQTLVFNAKVGHNSVIEPGCTIVGVEIPDYVYVPAGTTVSSLDDVISKVRPIYAGYTYVHTNEAVVHVNEALAEAYLAVGGTIGHIAANVSTDFSRAVTSPTIDGTTFVHPLASVIGNSTLEGHIMISPCASVRGDEGQPIFVGDSANIQDGVVLHGLETEELAEGGEWEFVNGRQFTAEGQRVSDGSGYSVYVAERVSLAHQAQIHGPAFVGHDTFIGMQTLVFNAKVGHNSVIEPGCTIVGVEIPDYVYVPAGSTVSSLDDVATKVFPIYAGYTYEHTNEAVVHVNEALAEGYLAEGGAMGHIAANVVTDFSHIASSPMINGTTFVHPLASVIGNSTLEGHIMISPCASVRGDEGQPIFVGDSANIQDGVVLHALETEELAENGELEFVKGRQFTAEGQRVSDGSGYSVYVAERVSLAHQAQIHGPAYVGHDTFIGMQTLVFNAKVGHNSVIEPGCTIVGVEIPDYVYVPAGTTISSAADMATKVFPIYAGYTYEHTNEAVVHVNDSLAEAYIETFEKEEPVADTIAPVITCSSNITLDTTADGVLASNAKIKAFLSGVKAMDDVDGSVTITSNAPAKFGIGNTQVSFSATDKAGNTSTCNAIVTVNAAGNYYTSVLWGSNLFSSGLYGSGALWGTYTPYMFNSQQQMWNLYQLSPLMNFTVLWQPSWSLY